MRLIVPFAYYYPEQCAGLNIIDDVVNACAREGIDVTMYVPTPTRNVVPGAKWERDEYKAGRKIHIHRFRMYGEGKNPVLRALRYLFCELYWMHKLVWEKYDVAFIDSTPPIQGLKLAVVKRLRKVKVVHNSQDIFPDSLVGAGLASRGGALWKIGCWVSNVTFRNSDKIIAISQDFRSTLLSKNVPDEKIVVVYNWVDENKVKPVAKKDNPLYEEFGLDRNKFRVVYAGNLGNAQNTDVILDTASLLAGHDEIEFVIFGSGGMEEDIRARINAEKLANVRLFPLQSADRVSFVYGLGDLCVVSCKPGFGGSAMPSKTWSILSSGRPVLANFDEGELMRTIQDNNLGVFTKAGDSAGMAEEILFASAHKAEFDQMGRTGRQFILDNLTRKKNTAKYVAVIKNVIEG